MPVFTIQEQEAVAYAASILKSKIRSFDAFTSSKTVKDYLQLKMSVHEREVFTVLFLDNQHKMIEVEDLFFGTIDSASVYPREILKRGLHHNAAAVIFCHNHPSGDATPSTADLRITKRTTEALKLIDIRVLDHIVVGVNNVVSMNESGMM